MNHKLTGKVALVTGAGSGIGRATALLLAERGARIAALGFTKSRLEETAAIIKDKQTADHALVLQADISDYAALETAVSQIINQWGRLDIVFANAGINGVWAPLEELDPDEWQKTIRVNLTGTFFTLKTAVPYLKKQGGSIIITASVNGTRIFSNTGATAYSATKAGQVAIAKMLALELAKHRIWVNAICPGAIATNIEENTEKQDVAEAREPVNYPAGRIPLTDGQPGTAAEVAELVAFLASDAARHITGTEVWIDGAESLLQG
ncbi:MAG: 3-oxoacyl-[acyl-carrier-protein] reductase [Anaerolineaceae bacterium]|nr:3-oxoacyl-[acyl-carrier-protein] reductase [Anaerolineaceae bacterium]